jgi:hypothetical protein
MQFARVVFRIAAVFGVLLLGPLYFMFDLVGREDPPPITHPQFYYGFVGVALVWQFVYFLIGTDPVQAVTGAPDAILGVLFVMAFFRTGR